MRGGGGGALEEGTGNGGGDWELEEMLWEGGD